MMMDIMSWSVMTDVSAITAPDLIPEVSIRKQITAKRST